MLVLLELVECLCLALVAQVVVTVVLWSWVLVQLLLVGQEWFYLVLEVGQVAPVDHYKDMLVAVL
jgi:hypothetical protein